MSLTVLEIMILYFYYEVTVVTEFIPPCDDFMRSLDYLNPE